LFSHAGFLGTKAPMYMDLVTIYFALLPLLLGGSIYFAIKKEYNKHFFSQAIILAITLLVVVIFEIGLRVSGGFLEYSQSSSISYTFMLTFLIIHILIAIASIAGWLYLFITSFLSYKKNKYKEITNSNHKKIGKAIFISLTISSLMGICIYIFLFIY
jgi:putative membrane protein